MMADTKQAPLASVPMFSVPRIDLSKVNPTGVGTDPGITENYKTLLEAQKRYADELEARYAQPNYFKIAAGFAKPQLGGFLASLGSASEALGEQQELQRAIAPTVAQMRAEIAKGNIALGQGVKAAEIVETAGKAGRILSPVEAAQVSALTGGPGGVAAAGQNIASAQESNLRSNLTLAKDYADFIARLGPGYTEDRLKKFFADNPTLTPPVGTPSHLLPGASAAPSAAGASAAQGPAGAAPAVPAAAASGPAAVGASVAGVPAEVLRGLPYARQLELQALDAKSMQEELVKINTTLGQQATTAVPIFEVATNLYKAASKPSLAVAFGVFEKGDPLSIIGKALESGSFPSVIANMRQYITQSRLGQDKKKQAISDLQAMEGALADLQTKMQNGVINPTDVRTMFESESIPNTRNTQDAFLRGIARIGSDALSRYEIKKAFDKATSDPKFNPRQWTNSDYFKSVSDNANKRTQALIMNPASVNLPRFMQQGLSGAYEYNPQQAPAQQAPARPASGQAAPRSRTADFEAEARRRGLIQ